MTKTREVSRCNKKDSQSAERLLDAIWPHLPMITLSADQPGKTGLAAVRHVLFVFSLTADGEKLPASLPGRNLLSVVMVRKGIQVSDLKTKPQQVTNTDGALWSFLALDNDPVMEVFELQTLLRKALAALFDEKPPNLSLVLLGEASWSKTIAPSLVYVALANALPLRPALNSMKKNRKANDETALEKLAVYGVPPGFDTDLMSIKAQIVGNYLARRLSVLPSNVLQPGLYRDVLISLAKKMYLDCEIYDISRLKKIGAGAFLAVAQGSPGREAVLVRLSYRPPAIQENSPLRRIALVGKGVCFDTGGLDLKPPRHMAGMHEDMNGSAVTVGLLTAAAQLQLPFAFDAWLAIAENDLSPTAYKQGDVIEALNGDLIEIVHTDAEGRLLLADALTLAVKQEPTPDIVIDFATLTGSMITALGCRYAGVFTNASRLAVRAVEAGRVSGERVCAFPADADYAEALETPVADIKQCTLENAADHILAACFLRRFTAERPWVHVDLSTSTCEGGLGAVSSETTGFGVGWGLAFLKDGTIFE